MRPAGNPVALALAVFAVWFLWGATPAGMRLAMGTMPPFVMATVRFFVAGTIVCGVAAALGRARPTKRALWNALVSGFLLLFLGNGLMTWGLQYLPTGLSAILMSLSPIWLALIEFGWANIVPSRVAMAGMVLGVAGIAVLFQPRTLATLPLYPLLIALLSSVCWAVGSAYQRHARSENPLLATGLQMIFAAAMFALEAAVVGDWGRWDPRATTMSSMLGLVWLIVSGSLISFPAFVYMMRHAGTALASTYAYVNPLVTIALGMLLFHERFTAPEGIAAGVILTGVALMMLRPGEFRVRAPAEVL